MVVKMVVSGAGRVSIRIKTSSRVEVATASADLRLLLGDAGDATSVYTVAPGRDRRGDGTRARRPADVVTPEMEAAAVRVFLDGADVARLGRSLSAVYEAMRTVRRRQRDDG